ncbi:MAG: beta-ketoacyl synthase N-terminal-like domain-containing protein, partial [Geminicoccaceae bacterium]
MRDDAGSGGARREGKAAYRPIAIIGIGCRFPGGISSPRTFWEFLIEGRDGTGDVPSDRWSIDKYHDPDPGQAARVYARRGGFIDGVSGFDPQFFGISPREAAYVDPQHRLLLETTWEAFEDGGISPRSWAGRRVGVFVGLFTHDYENLHMRVSERDLYAPHSATGMSTTIAANRLSHAFDFRGPSMVIDTACSSSLVAVHMACRSLHEGEADLAVAGGVNLQLAPEMTMALCKASMLAPDGRCKPFDARANGYARSDGAGMVALKTLDHALADGDAIYAVIRGSAVNQDGRTSGITVPSGEAQQQVMRDALDRARIAPSDISYVEAHGTGTPVGDPIEATALGSVLTSGSAERPPCVIGSVKGNFGHAESAAGIAGLIKLALMQRHGRIPPNLHFETPNPAIPFERLRLRVPTAVEEWPADATGQRLAGINSFGFGGTNAHAIVGSAPQRPGGRLEDGDGRRALPYCLSARSEVALAAMAPAHAAFLRSPAAGHVSLRSMAAQLALGREHHSFRLVAAGRSRLEIADALDAFAARRRQQGLASAKVGDGAPSPLVFVCSGMGQQWWAMGRGLLESEPLFADKIAQLDDLFGQLNGRPFLRETLAADEGSSDIDRTERAQPAIFSIQIALAALWNSWGVGPDMVVGHSVGEVAAACIAGALSLEDAVTVCFHRSRLQAGLAGRGGMMAVGLPPAALRQRIGEMNPGISIAAVNSPGSTTLAGDLATLERLAADLEVDGVFARLLNVEVPYHSAVMDEIAAPFAAAFRGLSPRAASIPLISTVTGEQIDGSTLDAAYWNRNIREPVSFARAMATLIGRQGRAFVEIGAHPVLASAIRECLAADSVRGTAVASLRRNQDDALTFMAAVGQLYCEGHRLDFASHLDRPCAHLDLPTYPWQHTAYWTESAESRRSRCSRTVEGGEPDHRLLGERQSCPDPAWRSEINAGRPDYLKDHRVQGAVVFPAAAYLETALAAAAEVGGPVAIENVGIEAPLVLTADRQTRLQLSLTADRHFQIHSLSRQGSEDRWTRHATGQLSGAAQDGDAPLLDGTLLQDRLPNMQDRSEIYRRLDCLGLQYGDQFHNLEAAWCGVDEALGRISATPEIAAEAGRYQVHPAILDAAFQLLATLPVEGTYLPVGVERIVVHRPRVCAAWAFVRKVSETSTRIVADVTLADEEGRVVVAAAGLTCRLFDSGKRGARTPAGTFLYDRIWIDSALADRSQPRQAGFLPGPPMLAPILQERHDRRNAESRHERFVRQALPALDDLATAYFVDALATLGWDWHRPDTFSSSELAETIGIATRHRRLLERMLMLLRQSGYLRRSGERWQVREAPPFPSVTAQWRALASTYPECHAELSLLRHCGSQLDRLLRDDQEPVSMLFPPGSPIAEHLYSDSPTCRPYNRIVADAVAEIVRRLPEGETLRILEVGAGTGGLASLLLPILPAERVEYVFTDVSQAFLNQAKDRFQAFSFVRYQILDAEDEPGAQGFADSTFDLVVACDAVHATADLRGTLGNLFRLLAPGGLLALVELTASPRWCDLVFGLLPDWWAFSDRDLRPEHCTLPASAWQSVLAACGYEAFESIADRFAEQPRSLQSVLLARRPDVTGEVISSECTPLTSAGLSSDPHERAPVVLLGEAGTLTDALARELGVLGHAVTAIGSDGHSATDGSLARAVAGAAPPRAAAPVVVELRGLDAAKARADGDGPSAIGASACQNLQQVVRALGATSWRGKPELFVVTSGTETVGGVTGRAPEQAPLRGFARVARTEHAEINTRLVDLGPDPDAIEIAALAREIASIGAEDEIALRGSRRYLSRVVRHRNLCDAEAPGVAFRVRKESRSSRDDLVYEEALVMPPGPGEVQVRVRAAGLNFKDLAQQAGLVETPTDGPGLEGAGTVVAVGEGVARWVPGNRVMGLINGSLGNLVNTDARLLASKPSNLSFEDAAGIPVVFLSAWQALKKQARLAAGETVLIHTAAGGLGMAALQVARALGGRVLATAGNDEKRAYLRACGVDCVGDSRSAAFAGEVLEVTAGQGVDVVLNTLPADMNRHNFRLLRTGSGRLVDLRNMHYGAQLEYGALQRGILFSAFDLGAVA